MDKKVIEEVEKVVKKEFVKKKKVIVKKKEEVFMVLILDIELLKIGEKVVFIDLEIEEVLVIVDLYLGVIKVDV